MLKPNFLLLLFGFALSTVFVVGCGVRGDPIPPGYPAELGRSRPMYKNPQHRLSYPKLPSPEKLKEKLKKEEKEDERAKPSR